MNLSAKWIKPVQNMGEVCPVFKKEFDTGSEVKKAVLTITAMGTYEASLNGRRISNYVLAPGWTSYGKRHQVQVYDIMGYLQDKNLLEVIVGKGWYRGRLAGWIDEPGEKARRSLPAGLIANLEMTYSDGTKEEISTDASWQVAESRVRFSEIYDGERYDASFSQMHFQNAEVYDWPTDNLIMQEGEEITEQERIKALRTLITPKGEKVIDFGQNLTGYVEFTVNAKKGDQIAISHAEVLDKEGNFYTDNYRSAKSKLEYVCRDGKQTYKPKLTFFGFRYIRLDSFPEEVDPCQFTAIAVHSDMKRTGTLQCSDPLLNQLFDNIFWGQKGNFLDIPTDCPQRDERLGWTGDAQVFIRTASYNYDVEKFFTKWLKDMSVEQGEDGQIWHVVPNAIPAAQKSSAAWGDAAVICPWQLYLTYGNQQILENQFSCMKKWISYITTHTKDQYLWTGGTHFGDWLALDAPEGTRVGATDVDFIASAFYAWSTSLVIRAGKVLEEDVSEYEKLYENIVKKFRKTFPVYKTQTEHVLAVYFNLAEDNQATADALAKMIHKCGGHLMTGFVGTPYLLHVLSRYGYTDLAYELLLRKEYPSWLYAVEKGATTIWEHWDSIMEDGSFWSESMNSFNHYAYGAVADWVYGVAAGIQTMEEYPGFEKVRIKPQPNKKLAWLEASIETRHGKIRSKWKTFEQKVKYEIQVPVPAVIVIDNKEYPVEKGDYVFYGEA